MLNIAVFDDNSAALKQLQTAIGRIMDAQNCDYRMTAYQIGEELECDLKNNAADVYFLDIRSDGDDDYGIRLSKKIRQLNDSAHIVFITALADKLQLTYSPDIRPSKFLVKPVTEKELEQTLVKIIELKYQPTIDIVCRRRNVRLRLGSILYVEREARQVSIYCGSQLFQTYESLDKLRERLGDDFFYIDRGVLVNRMNVASVDISRRSIVISDGTVKYISRRCAKMLVEMLNSDMGFVNGATLTL